MSNESTITKKGQITIPSSIRNKFNLKPGKKVHFVTSEEGIIIKPVIENIRSLRGIIKTEATVNDLQNEINGIRKEWTLDDK